MELRDGENRSNIEREMVFSLRTSGDGVIVNVWVKVVWAELL